MRWSSAVTFLGSILAVAQARPSAQGRVRRDIVAKEFKSYTAIGDSYGSGVGAGSAAPQDKDHTDCHRNVGAYAYLYAQKHPDMEFQFNACSGAQSGSTLDVQVTGPNSVFQSPDLVTISAGGNDQASFFDIAVHCSVELQYGPCDDALAKASGTYNGQPFFDSVKRLIVGAATHNPYQVEGRLVLVMGYPELYNQDSERPDCMSREYRGKINNIAKDLNKALEKATKEAGDEIKGFPYFSQATPRFVNVNDKFKDHHLCNWEERSWIIGGPDSRARINETFIGQDFFHPNVDGHKDGFLAAMEEDLSSQDIFTGPSVP